MSSENQMAIKECNRLKLSQCMAILSSSVLQEMKPMGIAIHNPAIDGQKLALEKNCYARR